MGLLSTFGAASGRAFGLTRLSAAIKDAYFNLTTLLLPGNGTNGAQNNTFLDSSTNNFTITRNGNTTQGTFSPFSQTGWSNYFDGSGDYLTGTITAVNNTTMTMECWVWLNALDNVDGDHFLQVDNGANTNYTITHNGNGAARFLSRNNTGGAIFDLTSANSILQTNKWHHIVGVRNASAASLYVDGTRVATVSSPTVSSTDGTSLSIAYNNSLSPREPNGYISNARIVSGTAVYDPTSSSLTVPTSPLTAVSGTRILTCQSNRFVDNSGNNVALTITGTPSVQAFSPFAPTAAYSASTNGGSGYFDGTGDYLTAPSSSVWNLNTTPWTLEFWVYPTASGTQWWGQRASTSNFAPLKIGLSGTTLYLYGSSNNSSWNISLTGGSGTVRLNAWNHIVVQHDGTNFTAYVNGTREINTANAAPYSSTAAQAIGATTTAGDEAFSGYMGSVRLIKGQVLYSGTSITVPNAPLTTTGYGSTSQSITGTVGLLLNYTNAGITDATAKNVLETVGNAQISTTQSKWGGGSLVFDGTDDRLSIPSSPNLDFGSGDFTIECWAYNTAWDTDQNQLFERGRFANGKSYRGWMKATQIVFEVNLSATATGAYTNITATVTNNLNQWYHVAFVRSGSNFYIFRDGVQVATTTNSAAVFTTTEALSVGGAADGNNNIMMNGYIDDFRITKGLARYTGNFTPPTAAFALQ